MIAPPADATRRPGRERARGSARDPRYSERGSAYPASPPVPAAGAAAAVALRCFRSGGAWLTPGSSADAVAWSPASVPSAHLGRLPRLRVPGEPCRVLVPVGLAHPAESILLAGLPREVLDRRLVASIPKRFEPMHRRVVVVASAMSVAPSLVDARLASRRTSITRLARRCKAGATGSRDDVPGRRHRGPGDLRRHRRGGADRRAPAGFGEPSRDRRRRARGAPKPPLVRLCRVAWSS